MWTRYCHRSSGWRRDGIQQKVQWEREQFPSERRYCLKREVGEVSLRRRHLRWEFCKVRQAPLGSTLFRVHHIGCDGQHGCTQWRHRASSTPSHWARTFSPMWDNREKGEILSLKTHKRKAVRSSRNGGRVGFQLVEGFPSRHEALGLIPAPYKPGMTHTRRKWKKEEYCSRLHDSFKVNLEVGHMRPWEIEREGKKGKREARKRTKKEER